MSQLNQPNSPPKANPVVDAGIATQEQFAAATEQDALLAGCLLKAIAAVCDPIATGPWDKKPQATAGRLSHHLQIRVSDFSALALKGLKLRNYRKIPNPQPIKDLPLLNAA